MLRGARLPDFIGVGAQKAGTSWIHACLYEHPSIYMPSSKEIHFFSNYYIKGKEWYISHFSDCLPHQLAGEYSPTYLYHADAPMRIYDHNPHVKLIICLRNPVERVVSAYRYAIQTRAISPSLSLDKLMNQRPSYVEHSLYYQQICRYLQYFSREQLCITLYEDIALDPYTFMRNIYQFLDIDWHFRPAMAEQRVNASRGAPRWKALDTFMQTSAACLRAVGLGHIVWRMGRSGAVELLRRLNARAPVQQPVSEACVRALRQRFAPDVRGLAALIQRDLRDLWFEYDGVTVGS